ncbi:transglycosylase domain-containing protein [Jeotgalibacillus sp. ET6]|uniref:transglycosylase domain-containing protein n=1 Tax=Jeotgalibacillus sp. ET6 TaxID=3037260 RepID=UPI0024189B3A|nr:transglycosylase domain-containing protein [Jeotgalibacillus sp. ET6]MDG5471803.1 transglycosylase domain-containing protein [Jeotgalibacillus sp. ET6]
MRMTIGYITIGLLLPLCLFFWIGTNKEYQSVLTFNEALSATIDVEQSFPSQTSFLVDKNGDRFSQGSSELRYYAEEDQIPDFLKDIIIYSEDRNFYDHIGFDAGAIIRAVVKNLVFTHIQQGGSTITQQLARNLYLTQEKTYNRKLTELVYSYELEQSLTKDEILQGYFNIIYFSNGVYGIRAASLYYFQQELEELSYAQLAFLAAIPNNPGKYDPIDHFDAAKERQERLIDLMVAENKIQKDEGHKIKAEKISLDIYESIDLYPDYAVYVEHELMKLIALTEGYAKKIQQADSDDEANRIQKALNERTNQVLQSGVTIHTALDPVLQRRNIQAVQNNLPYEGVEGASVIIRNATREIVSVAGGKDYQKYNFNRSFQAVRQPGSAIKPLLVYGPYIEHTQPALSQIVDASSYCQEAYCPENYGGANYNDVTLSTAFFLSLNTPAIRLLERTGVEEAHQYLTPFAFKHVEKRDETLASAVGGFTYGMTPLEMTDAYTSFIDGTYTRSHAIVNVTDDQGNILYEWPKEPVTIWSPQTTSKLRDLLSQAALRGTGKPAYVNKPYVGIKTGTTNQYFDYWTIGLTDEFTTGVWVGHDLPQSMEKIEYNRPAHAIWREIMQ